MAYVHFMFDRLMWVCPGLTLFVLPVTTSVQLTGEPGSITGNMSPDIIGEIINARGDLSSAEHNGPLFNEPKVASSSPSSLLRSEPRASWVSLAAPANRLTPINCEWNDWGSWSDCTASCNGGVSTRTRSVAVEKAPGGHDCDGSREEQLACNAQGCPVDCVWSDWGHWATCSRTCGGGVMHRNRTVLVPDEWGGARCEGSAAEEEACGMQACPVDCEWSHWSGWGTCSQSCGGGVSTRNRTVTVDAAWGGRNCTGFSGEDKSCNEGCPVDCRWTPWGGWSACTKTCGGGQSVRGRSVAVQRAFNGSACEGEPEEAIDCNIDGCPVNCRWAAWDDWRACTVSCGGGTQTRTRTKAAEANFGGADCVGSASSGQACNTEGCPVDCTWQDWMPWGTCSVTCGSGVKVRTRAKQMEVHGGTPCYGTGVENGLCSNFHNCPAANLDNLVTQAPTTPEPAVDASGDIILNVSDPQTFVESNDVEDAMIEGVSIIGGANISSVVVSLRAIGGALLQTPRREVEPTAALDGVHLARHRWLADGAAVARKRFQNLQVQDLDRLGWLQQQQEKRRHHWGSGQVVQGGENVAVDLGHHRSDGTQMWKAVNVARHFSHGGSHGSVDLRYVVHHAPDTVIQNLANAELRAISSVLASALARHQLSYMIEAVSVDIDGNTATATTTPRTSAGGTSTNSPQEHVANPPHRSATTSKMRCGALWRVFAFVLTLRVSSLARWGI